MSFKNRDIVTKDETRTGICEKMYPYEMSERATRLWRVALSDISVGGDLVPPQKNYARMRSL